ncbi:MAG: DUF559 domain-containing protein [Methylococcaceae bacterium]|jgi:hypothetical protein
MVKIFFQQANQLRNEYLNGLGLRVLRFNNRQVLLEIEEVLECISKIPPPFFKGGGGNDRLEAEDMKLGVNKFLMG